MTSENHAFKSTNIVPAEPEDYSKVLNRLMACSLAGQGQFWPRGERIQPHTPTYFKPSTNLYRDTLRKDRRDGKELEYIHSCGTWTEQAICAFDLFAQEEDPLVQGRLLYILSDCLQAIKEILAMRTSHFHAKLTKGPAIARQLADLVEAKVKAKHCQVPSTGYADVYSELSAKYVIQAAKELAKNEMETPESSKKVANPKPGNSTK